MYGLKIPGIDSRIAGKSSRIFLFMRDDHASRTALEAIRIMKPGLVFNGHMHSGAYKTTYSHGEQNTYT